MEHAIPAFVKPFLWSYDIAALDVEGDKALIIKNVLDHGTKEATDWVRAVYGAGDIADVIASTPASAWSRKSLALWSLLYGVVPSRAARFAA